MPQKKHITLEEIINKHYDILPEAERKLADTILDFPGELASYTATELADLAGVSKAAATRFFKRLGFNTYEEARRLARDSKDWGSPLYLQSKKQLNESSAEHINLYAQEEVNNIEQTLSNIPLDKLEEACKAIVDARKVWVLGYRNSHYIATYARWQLIQFRPDVHVLPSGAGETLGEYLADISKEDIVIIIGVRRRVTTLIDVMKAIHTKGAPILYLTDPTASRTSGFAKWVIRSAVSNSFLFDSYTALLSVTRLIAVESYRLSGKKGKNHLQLIEKSHAELNEFE